MVTNIGSLYNFCFGSILKDFTNDEPSKISLISNVCDFSVAYTSIKKEDILNIH